MNPGSGRVLLLRRAVSQTFSVILAAICLLGSAAPASPPPSQHQSPSASPQQSAADKQQQITTLEPDKLVEREIAGGEKHSYQVALSEGQYLRLEIQWQDTDVGVSLQTPDGTTYRPQDATGLAWEVSVEQVAESAGIYRINVYARKRAPTGRYSIRIADQHAATEKERALQQARSLSLEALLLRRDGKYAEGVPLVLRALEIRERVSGPDSLVVAWTLSMLANNYRGTGDYASAESAYLRALKIIERTRGPEHTDVAAEIDYLASLYSDMGDDLRAEQLYQKSLRIFEKAGRSETQIVAQMLGQLGDICQTRGDFQCAESFYQRSRVLEEKLLGPDSFHLSFSLARLGRAAYDAGNYSEAEEMFQRSLTLYEKALGTGTAEGTDRLNDLAMLYCTTGDYAKARALYERALASHEQQQTMSNLSVQAALFGLARLYAAQGMATEAIVFQTRAIELEERYVDLNLAIGSEREKLSFLASLAEHSYRNISLHIHLAPNDPAARDLAVTTVLQRKGRVQDAMSGSLSALRQRSSPEDQGLLDQFNALTSKLAALVLTAPINTPVAEQQKQIKALEEQRDDLEAEISRRTAGFYERSRPITLAMVQGAVPENAALIEFAAYRPFDPKAPDNTNAYGEPRYVAYVIRKQAEVRWAELGEAKEIDSAIAAWRQALRDPLRTEVRQLSRSLDEKVMRPVRALTGDATQLLVSPDGELNLIPFEALLDGQGSYLIERYSIGYLTSGRDLLRMQVPRTSESGPLLVADPWFGDPEAVATAVGGRPRSFRERPAAGRRSVTTGNNLSSVYFAPLTGTAREAHTIQTLFPEAKVLTGQQATKSALKSAVAPSLLHIATHGFFLRDAGSEPVRSGVKGTRAIRANVKIENPLLRSGLALAGANLNKGANSESGILTALEASNLNLWGTKLVTLSACDTGVGEVRNGEGVYGLRRAFFLAGTESLVMSLWPVSDYITSELMAQYYEGLKKGLGRREALRQAQLAMLKRKARQHPFYWASFIQAGEWANLDGQR